MKIHRGKIIDKICERIGVRRRVKPGSSYMTKRELIRLNSYLDVGSGKGVKG